MKTKMIRAALAAICVMPIVAWNDSNRPDFSKVEFVKGDDGKKYSLVKKDDGLYVSNGFVIIVK